MWHDVAGHQLETLAPAVRREAAEAGQGGGGVVAEYEVHPTGDGDIGLTKAQALTSKVQSES